MGNCYGVGVDIVELERVRAIRCLRRFAELVLSKRELAELAARTDAIAFVASRFAAKEAVIKACPQPLTAQDFEIRKRGPKPYVHFFNPAHRRCRVSVSLAHSTDYAAGYAIAEAL